MDIPGVYVSGSYFFFFFHYSCFLNYFLDPLMFIYKKAFVVYKDSWTLRMCVSMNN